MTLDLNIYYSSLSSPHYINCWCSRWSTDNYAITLETWLTKSQLQTLRSNITPGAADELYTILGKPTFYDATWQGQNTIRLEPTGDSSTLSNMRNEKLIYVKNITDSPLEGANGYLQVKIEGYISGSIL